jgi:hypothetical protein
MTSSDLKRRADLPMTSSRPSRPVPKRIGALSIARFVIAAFVAWLPLLLQAAPHVQWFGASPSTVASGGTTALGWHVDGATSVRIDPGVGVVDPSGSVSVSPVTTTMYTLTASDGPQSAVSRQTVVVGPNASRAGGRFVSLMAPIGGQDFTAPATLRVFASAYDPNVFDGCGIGGTARGCASRVDFYVDDTLMAQVPTAQSEYWVFKARINGVGAGLHRVWARAIYTNPAATLDSESAWIQVLDAPSYAQTVDLAGDIVLSGTQNYELQAPPNARIRLNGHGHRIRSAANWSGRLTLTGVDVFDLGANDATIPSIDVATTAAVRIEGCVFDTTGTVAVDLSGAASASIVGNTFRSNMRMAMSQQPEFEPQASYPAFSASGNSSGAKVFSGNSIGLGWAYFSNTDRWVIGGSAAADANVVLGPRAGIWAKRTLRSVIRGNLVYQTYFGGWSQGNNMEVDDSPDLLIEHNLVGGGSWPIRGLGGTLRYNLVLDAGHQWLWVSGDGAAIHHNVFAGGEAEIAGIRLIYGPRNVQIYNNTIDGLRIESMTNPIWVEDEASADVRANAIVNMRNSPGVLIDGSLSADYNLFWGRSGSGRNYSDDRHPAHDVGAANAQADPKFSGAMQPFLHRHEDLWTRALSVRDVLAHYRQRYMPAAGSPLIDAGGPRGGGGPLFFSGFEPADTLVGNDIGAVGAGVTAADDQFGR